MTNDKWTVEVHSGDKSPYNAPLALRRDHEDAARLLYRDIRSAVATAKGRCVLTLFADHTPVMREFFLNGARVYTAAEAGFASRLHDITDDASEGDEGYVRVCHKCGNDITSVDWLTMEDEHQEMICLPCWESLDPAALPLARECATFASTGEANEIPLEALTAEAMWQSVHDRDGIPAPPMPAVFPTLYYTELVREADEDLVARICATEAK